MSEGDLNLIQRLAEHASAIPFIGMMTKRAEGQPIITRLIEAAIIGGVVMYGTVQAVSKDIIWLKSGLTEVKSSIRDMRQEIHDIELKRQ